MWVRVVRNSQERSSYHHHHKLPVLGLPWYLYLPVRRPGALGGSQPPSPLEREGSPDFTLCWQGRKGAPSVIRNCGEKVLPQAAQVAPIHPSLCWPGEAGRCSRLVPTALVALGSLENRTHPGWVHMAPSRLPPLLGPTTSHCWDWHSVGRCQLASGNLVANQAGSDTCPHASAAGAWRPPISRGWGGGQGGVSRARSYLS